MPRLKRWESPRREGRNDKGKGGSAKKKQWLKRQQALRNKLKKSNNNNNHQQGGDLISPFFLFYLGRTSGNTTQSVSKRFL